MRAYRIDSPEGVQALKIVNLPEPTPGPGEVLIAVKACSLNYRDSLLIQGGYPRNRTYPVIPLSDGAGEVVAIGPGVTRFKVGDRVAANFMRDWIGGPINEHALLSSLGGGINGMLAERVCLPAHSVVHIPGHLSFEEASTLPCAALTAWNALSSANTKAGDTVLVLGTGGVSIFALQLAKAFGARVITTSGSDDKAAKAKTLGADAIINYRKKPEWHEEVRNLTGGVGVDLVLEVGGPGTFERSIKSTRVGGTIALIGLLDMGTEPPNIIPLLLNAQKVHGIYVGSVAMFEDMNRAITVNQIRPVIDRVFPFEETRQAYEHLMSQKHLGKIVIRVGEG
jgi:NADPH:quinone reductase-like Zn-dependent oxidoreductase